MFAKRSTGTSKSLLLINTLLLSTAFALPAMAQIEEVVVTAQKRSENIQQVPIAVTAFSAQDLAAHQIKGFGDLRFDLPSVSFSHGNFGPSNFTIRGIGSAAISTSGDAGVSVNINDFYLSSPPLTSGVYYDLDRVEVLRGPQSTLYGRNATGGAINTITAKPDLDTASANLEITGGAYGDLETQDMVNLPIVEGQLGVRIAAQYQDRDGTITNIYPSLHPGSGVASHFDSRDDFSMRGSVRWEPSDHTTVDAMVQYGQENDTRVRSQQTRCITDPSGILGCLPFGLAAQPENENATLGRTYMSDIGPFGPHGASGNTPFTLDTVAGIDGNPITPSITDPVGQQVPQSLEKVNSDFTPTSRGSDKFASVHWEQRWLPWLRMDFLGGFDSQNGTSQQAYTTSPGANFAQIPMSGLQSFLVGVFGLPAGSPTPTSRLMAAEEIFGLGIPALGGLLPPHPISYGTFFKNNLGQAPLSNITNNGSVGDSFSITNHEKTFDQISGDNTQTTLELRFASDFSGPFNFLIAAYHLNFVDYNVQYYVDNSSAFDIPSIFTGGLAVADGILLDPAQFDSNNQDYKLNSNAMFGEAYYNILDDLKLTVGARYTNDDKSFESRQLIFTTIAPIGTTGLGPLLFPSGTPTPPGGLYVFQKGTYSAWTGRGVIEWTPKTSFTDQTTVYASYSRGWRSGGFNPPPFSGSPGYSTTFAPETLDSYEIGTKNTLPAWGFGTLQANLDGWYYIYKGFQVSEIIDRTSVNANINSKLWGAEGEFIWAPTDALVFNLTTGYTHSALDGGQTSLDTRNPTLGTPGYTLLKDYLGANCAIVNTGGGAAATAATPGFGAILSAPPAQPGPGVAQYAAYLNYPNSCSGIAGLPAGYALSQGVPKNLGGNPMPNTPNTTLAIGVQYTFNLGDDYSLVPRVDWYWQNSMEGSIFADGADFVKAFDVMNAQIQLNSPDNLWYARAAVANVFDRHYVTGEYKTDPSSGLFTNEFVGDPRLWTITFGVHL